MNEKNPGFKFLISEEEIKKNFDNLVHYVGCNCINCSPRIHEAAQFHIATAPLKEQRFMTEEILIADIVTMQTSKRKTTILKAIEDGKSKPKAKTLWS